jgi:hypothetical protein
MGGRFVARVNSRPDTKRGAKCRSFDSWAARSAAHFAQDDIPFLLLRMTSEFDCSVGHSEYWVRAVPPFRKGRERMGQRFFAVGAEVWARLRRVLNFSKNGWAACGMSELMPCYKAIPMAGCGLRPTHCVGFLLMPFHKVCCDCLASIPAAKQSSPLLQLSCRPEESRSGRASARPI